MFDPDAVENTPEDVLEAIGRAAVEVGAKAAALGDIHEDFRKLRSSIELLATAISSLASKDEVEARLAEERREATSRRRKLIAAFSTAALAVLLAFFALLFVAKGNQRNGSILVDCTTPGPKPPPVTGHPCYDRGTQTQIQAIARIVDSNGNGVLDVDELRALIQQNRANSAP